MAQRISDDETTSFLFEEKDTTIRKASRVEIVSKSYLPTHLIWALFGFAVSSIAFTTLGVYLGQRRSSTLGQPIVLSEQFWPDLPLQAVTFRDEPDWEDDGVLGDHLWANALPRGMGYTVVPKPRDYDLPPSAPFKKSKEHAEIYVVAVSHHLHCLATIRETIKSYAKNEVPRFDAQHCYHCLNYLRRGVECASDTGLERGTLQPIENGTEIDWVYSTIGSVHQCRDWKAVKAIIEEHRSNDKQDIL